MIGLISLIARLAAVESSAPVEIRGVFTFVQLAILVVGIIGLMEVPTRDTSLGSQITQGFELYGNRRSQLSNPSPLIDAAVFRFSSRRRVN